MMYRIIAVLRNYSTMTRYLFSNDNNNNNISIIHLVLLHNIWRMYVKRVLL